MANTETKRRRELVTEILQQPVTAERLLTLIESERAKATGKVMSILSEAKIKNYASYYAAMPPENFARLIVNYVNDLNDKNWRMGETIEAVRTAIGSDS